MVAVSWQLRDLGSWVQDAAVIETLLVEFEAFVADGFRKMCGRRDALYLSKKNLGLGDLLVKAFSRISSGYKMSCGAVTQGRPVCGSTQGCRMERRRRSADTHAQSGANSGASRELMWQATASRFGSRQYSKFGNLRYVDLNQAQVSVFLHAVNTEIRTQPVLNCPLCGTSGKTRYAQMRDRSYAAPGTWELRECDQCRALWLHPQPTPEDVGLAYQGYYTHAQPAPGASLARSIVWGIWHSYLRMRFGYSQGVGAAWKVIFGPLALFHPGGPDDLGAAAMYLPKPPSGAKVLDVGCGSGVLLARMKLLGWDTCGVEVDGNAVGAARARGLDIRHGQLAECKFPENQFDAVHLSHVIEHVYDPGALLRECHRVLKPGGTLVVLTPNTASWGHRRFKEWWLNLDPPRHLILFNRGNFRSLVEKAGFTVARLDSSVHTAWVYGGLSRAAERTGRSEMSELGKLGCLAYGAMFQFGERLRRVFDAEAGDEILLLAKK